MVKKKHDKTLEAMRANIIGKIFCKNFRKTGRYFYNLLKLL